MNRDDIEHLTREAGCFDATPKFLERFAALVAAAEREAILAIAGSHGFNRMYGERSPSASDLVAVIRARGNHA
jgi:hypothetical protein